MHSSQISIISRRVLTQSDTEIRCKITLRKLRSTCTYIHSFTGSSDDVYKNKYLTITKLHNFSQNPCRYCNEYWSLQNKTVENT